MKKDKQVKEKKSFEVLEKEERLIMEKDELVVKKLESLVRLLEASEPYDLESPSSEKPYGFRSILDAKNKDRVIFKIFELLKQY